MKKQRESEYSFIDHWDILEQANIHCNAHLVELKNSFISWANKYNLVDDKLVNKIFLEIGFWAIPGRRDHAQSVEDWKIFFEKMDREIPGDFLH